MVNKRIVLMHGWRASTEKFEKLEKELKSLSWDALLLKLPGFDAPRPDTIWDLEDYSIYVILGAQKRWGRKKFFLFGHSFGGRIAIKVAVSNPAKLSGVVLCATGGITRSNFIKRNLFYVLAKLGKVLVIIPPLAKIFKRLLYKMAREHDYEREEGVMKETFKRVISEDLKFAVTRIKLPVLILWGKKDRMTPYSDALYLKRKVRNSALVTYDAEGHTLPYIKPKKVAQDIEKWFHSLNLL